MIREATMAGQLPVVNLFPHANYPIRSKQPKRPEKNVSVVAYLDRLQHKYERDGMQTSVYGIFLVHVHNHPNVCLLKINGNPTHYKLPGGRLKPGENEIDGLKRKLCSKLGSNSSLLNQEWQIGECVGVWWRPNFDTLLYPHCSPDISTKPKIHECKKLYLVHLPQHSHIFIPTNQTLVYKPLFDVFVANNKNDNPAVFYLPDQLSRFKLNVVPRGFYGGRR